MKIKVSELTGAALDWAVAKAFGYNVIVVTGQQRYDRLDPEEKADREYSELIRSSRPMLYWDNPTARTPCPSFSTDWVLGGQIIERELIELRYDRTGRWANAWIASTLERMIGGPTPLIAAMRCYVAAKLGDEVDIPDELIG